MPPKKIKIKFCDFFHNFNEEDNDFVRILRERYDVVFSERPDYVFYSTFGMEHAKYDCVKIFYTGECVSPDFTATDYAIGFDYIQFGDRYLRVPLYRLFQYKNELKCAIQKSKMGDKKISDGFCSFVYSNNRCMPERIQMLEKINTYKGVSSGGKFLNNIGGPVPDKLEFLSHYKFNIAFENSTSEGYTTEKIMQAFAAGTVPIYYGNPLIAREFNPKSFINCHEYKDFDEVLDEIKRIDNDDNLYRTMLEAAKIPEAYLDDSDIREFLYRIFDQEPNKAKRLPSNAYTEEKRREEKTLRITYKLILQPYKKFRNLVNIIRRK